MRRISRAASLLVLFGVLGLLVAGTAAAATQTLVSGNGAVGGTDAAVQVALGSAWSPARIVIPHPHWAVIPGTQWVASAPGPSAGGNGGTGPSFAPVHYRIAFTLPPVFAAPSLTTSVYSDNYADVFLNGTLIGGQDRWDVPPEYNFGWEQTAATAAPKLIPTPSPTLFHAGVNYLAFDV